MPNSDKNIPSIEQNSNTPMYSLLQFSWENFLPTPGQKRIQELLKGSEAKSFSFNKSGHALSITTKHHLEDLIFSEAMKDPQIAVVTSSRVAHWQTLHFFIESRRF